MAPRLSTFATATTTPASAASSPSPLRPPPTSTSRTPRTKKTSLLTRRSTVAAASNCARPTAILMATTRRHMAASLMIAGLSRPSQQSEHDASRPHVVLYKCYPRSVPSWLTSFQLPPPSFLVFPSDRPRAARAPKVVVVVVTLPTVSMDASWGTNRPGTYASTWSAARTFAVAHLSASPKGLARPCTSTGCIAIFDSSSYPVLPTGTT